MGLFGSSTDVATDEVENATNEKNVEEDWSLIINICDKAGKSSEDAKSYLKAIIKRLYNSDPHIGVKAVTLLDACIKNSGKVFHVEVASRDFETDFYKLMTKAPPSVGKKLRESLKKWAENEFKSDVQLNLIPSLYSKLKTSGFDFSSDTPVKKTLPVSTDPNVVETQEEEAQILKAIELSLKETSGSPKSTTSSSLYPTMNISAAAMVSTVSTPAKELRKVRALYDFEAAEDNELTFFSGEIIFVIDDSDANWWKGKNQRGEGLFPANFVTADLSVEPEKIIYEKTKREKNVQFQENVEVKVEEKIEPEEVEINEEKINRLLHLLHEADPTNPESDTDEMLKLEREVNGMGPLIDSELERVDRKHAQLTKLSADLVEALGMYHTLMREPQFPPMVKVPYGYSSPPMTGYNGLPPNMHHPSMMGPPQMNNQGLPPGHERQQYMHPGMSQHQSMPQHYQGMGMPGPSTPGQMPPPGHHMPHGIPSNMGLPPMHNQMPDDRRHEPQMGQHYPGMPNYPPGMGPPNFQGGAPVPPSGVQNGQQQQGGPQPHFVSSSTHIMH